MTATTSTRSRARGTRHSSAPRTTAGTRASSSCASSARRSTRATTCAARDASAVSPPRRGFVLVFFSPHGSEKTLREPLIIDRYVTHDELMPLISSSRAGRGHRVAVGGEHDARQHVRSAREVGRGQRVPRPRHRPGTHPEGASARVRLRVSRLTVCAYGDSTTP